MYAFRSFDSGFSWSTPSVIQPATGEFWDLPRLTADPRRPKRAYYVYDLREPVGIRTKGYSLFSKTTNGGRTWSTPQKLYDPQTSNSWPGISKILVNEDGSLLDVMAIVASDQSARTQRPPGTRRSSSRSAPTDGGRTWSKPITIGRSSGRGRQRPGHRQHPEHLRHVPVADRRAERRRLRQLAAARRHEPVLADRGRTVDRLRPPLAAEAHRGRRAGRAAHDRGRRRRHRRRRVLQDRPGEHRGYWPARVRVATSTRSWSPLEPARRRGAVQPAHDRQQGSRLLLPRRLRGHRPPASRHRRRVLDGEARREAQGRRLLQPHHDIGTEVGPGRGRQRPCKATSRVPGGGYTINAS